MKVFIDEYENLNVIVYFFTDLILILKKCKDDKCIKVYKHIYINNTTFIKKIEGFFYFSNVFNVVGNNDSITFIA